MQQAPEGTPVSARPLSFVFSVHLSTICNPSNYWQHISGPIKVYLSAIWHIHVLCGMLNLFSQQFTPRLQTILKGIKKHQAASHPPRVCQPITIRILKQIRGILSHKKPSYLEVMFWATCCLAFFGFLHVSEFTVPRGASYMPPVHEGCLSQQQGQPLCTTDFH